MSAARVDILGVPVDVLTRQGLMERIHGYVDEGGRRTVAYLNMHVLDNALALPDLAAFLRGVDTCYCDGEGVRLVGRLLGHRLPERMTGADWIWDLAAMAEGRSRIAWIGGAPGVTARAARALRLAHPRLQIFTRHGYHPKDGPGNDALIHEVNAWGPHVVLVGMGTPAQERWVARDRDRLLAPVVWCLGATADFISGAVSRGPPWLHQRQEWLARLATDPRRLWRRYLIGNTRVMAHLISNNTGVDT